MSENPGYYNVPSAKGTLYRAHQLTPSEEIEFWKPPPIATTDYVDAKIAELEKRIAELEAKR